MSKQEKTSAAVGYSIFLRKYASYNKKNIYLNRKMVKRNR